MAFAITSDAADLSTFDFGSHSTIDVTIPTVNAADCIYINVAWNTSATCAVSGATNGALTADGIIDDLGVGGLKCQQFHKENASSTTNEVFTATFTGTAPGNCGLYGASWSGVATASAKDVEAGQADSGTAVNTTAQTTTDADLIIGTAWNEGNGNALTTGTGFTQQHSETVPAVAALHVESKVQGAAGSDEATWTGTAGNLYICQFLALKPTPAGVIMPAAAGSHVLTGIAALFRVGATVWLRYRK